MQPPHFAIGTDVKFTAPNPLCKEDAVTDLVGVIESNYFCYTGETTESRDYNKGLFKFAPGTRVVNVDLQAYSPPGTIVTALSDVLGNSRTYDLLGGLRIYDLHTKTYPWNEMTVPIRVDTVVACSQITVFTTGPRGLKYERHSRIPVDNIVLRWP
jgi:hypothetical protein